MAQPILYSISAFDKIKEQTFKFSYSGNQAYKNRLVIRNNVTNAVVYDNVQTTFKLQHDLPANTLTNGIIYNACLSVIDGNNVETTLSDAILFYCFTTPTFAFTNVILNQVIENSTYTVILKYSQVENELLNEYQIILYDQTMSQVFTSGVKYETINLQAVLINLEDNHQYFIQATGKTLNGMFVNTGVIPISVDYLSPITFSTISLENQSSEGNIKISANMYSILGKSNPDPATFINNESVDLKANGSWVKFDDNFLINKNFTLQCIGRNFSDFSEILTLSNGNLKLEIKYMKGKFDGSTVDKVFLILRAYNSLTNYELISNYINVPNLDTWLSIWVRHIDNVYELKIGEYVV
jgi:hypothetical protein